MIFAKIGLGVVIGLLVHHHITKDDDDGPGGDSGSTAQSKANSTAMHKVTFAELFSKGWACFVG